MSPITSTTIGAIIVYVVPFLSNLYIYTHVVFRHDKFISCTYFLLNNFNNPQCIRCNSSGTPRQDIPHPVLRDAAMFDDVFDKEGRLLSSRNVPKFTSPLNTVGYNR